MNMLYVLLMGAPKEGESPYSMLIMMALLVVVFWFFMIRPQMKKQKELKKFREDLKKGDKVVTVGGIHGKVEEIKDNAVIIEVEGQNKLKIEKSALVKDSTDMMQQK